MAWLNSYLHADFIHVFGDQVEEEEVSKLLEVVEPGLAEDVTDLVPADSAWPGLDHGSSDPWSKHHSQPVHQEDAGDGGNDDEPEPEKDVDLLIDDVER